MRTFEGVYSFNRSIDNPAMTINGTASFHKEEAHLIRYDERGVYLLGQKKYEFKQKRYFVFDEQFLKIYSEKDVELHRVYLGDLCFPDYSFSHLHKCQKDRYELHFCLEDDLIITKYKVHGPSKQYKIDTTYRRIG